MCSQGWGELRVGQLLDAQLQGSELKSMNPQKAIVHICNLTAHIAIWATRKRSSKAKTKQNKHCNTQHSSKNGQQLNKKRTLVKLLCTHMKTRIPTQGKKT